MDTEISTGDKIRIITSAANFVISSKLCPYILEKDDLISMGYIAFEEEVLVKWDSSISKNFELYAFWIIRNRIIDGIRRLCRDTKHGNKVSFDEIEYNEATDDPHLLDDVDELQYLLKALTEEQLDLLHKRFVLEMTLVAIAVELNISSDQAIYRINKALGQIKTKTSTYPG